MPDGENKAWTSDTLSDQGLKAFQEAATARWAGSVDDARTVRNVGLLAAAGGVIFGLGSLLIAGSVLVKAPVPQPPGYLPFDRSTGWISPPVSARDIPIEFTEATRRRALINFITACQAYIPQTWHLMDYHACMLYAAPEEQNRLTAEIGAPASPGYFPTLFGAHGWAMPTDFPNFQFKGAIGDPPNQTWHYEVRYKRKESINGKDVFGWYTAEVYFQFHPELKMSPKDRDINPLGFQAVSFSTVRE